MKRLGLLTIPVLLSACAAQIRVATPEPPVATVSVGVPAPAPEPAAPPAEAAADTAEPVPTDPEEVTATSEPPNPVYEEETDSPGPAYVWVGGYWGWNGVDWGWNWGHWAVAPEGQFYIEPYYERVGDHVVYVQGYWGPHDAPHRSYGGDRIQFSHPERPANYHRGEHVVVEHRAGPAPGHRPGGAYAHATGPARPLPRATAPQHRTAAAGRTATPRSEPKGAPGNEHAEGRATAARGSSAEPHGTPTNGREPAGKAEASKEPGKSEGPKGPAGRTEASKEPKEPAGKAEASKEPGKSEGSKGPAGRTEASKEPKEPAGKAEASKEPAGKSEPTGKSEASREPAGRAEPARTESRGEGWAHGARGSAPRSGCAQEASEEVAPGGWAADHGMGSFQEPMPFVMVRPPQARAAPNRILWHPFLRRRRWPFRRSSRGATGRMLAMPRRSC